MKYTLGLAKRSQKKLSLVKLYRLLDNLKILKIRNKPCRNNIYIGNNNQRGNLAQKYVTDKVQLLLNTHNLLQQLEVTHLLLRLEGLNVEVNSVNVCCTSPKA